MCRGSKDVRKFMSRTTRREITGQALHMHHLPLLSEKPCEMQQMRVLLLRSLRCRKRQVQQELSVATSLPRVTRYWAPNHEGEFVVHGCEGQGVSRGNLSNAWRDSEILRCTQSLEEGLLCTQVLLSGMWDHFQVGWAREAPLGFLQGTPSCWMQLMRNDDESGTSKVT